MLWLNDYGFHPLTPFTRDREALLTAVARHSGSLPSKLMRGDSVARLAESFSALQQIAQFDAGPSGPFSAPLTQPQTDFLNALLPSLGTAASGAVAQVAANGVAQSRVENAQAQLADRKTASDAIVGKIAEADPAKAAVDLQLASTALQASAQVFSVLQGSSLLSVLISR